MWFSGRHNDETKAKPTAPAPTAPVVVESESMRKLRESQKGDFAGDIRRKLKEANRAKDDVQSGLRVLGAIGRLGFGALRLLGQAAALIPGPAKAFGHAYMKHVWHPHTWTKDADGDAHFSKKRATAVIALTAVFAGVVVPLAAETAFYEATKKDEVVYLHMAENTSDDHVYTVDGAYSYPASPEDALHYQIKDSLFNDGWSLFHHGKKFFPDYVKAPIAPVPNRCEVHSYGFRAKLISRYGHIYPQILDVSCQPLGMRGDEGKSVAKGDHRVVVPDQAPAPRVTAPATPVQAPPPAPTAVAPVFNQQNPGAAQPTDKPAATPPAAAGQGQGITPPPAAIKPPAASPQP